MIEIPQYGLPDFFTKEEGAPLCSETAPDIFFIDSEEGATPAEVYAGRKLAKQICSGCPYRVECAEWAIDKGETLGVWGGLTPRERADIKRARRNGRTVLISELRVHTPDKTTKPNRNGAGKKRATASLD